MFRCSDKCIGKIAAKNRLNREEACYDAAKKDGDQRGMVRAKKKMQTTQTYLDLMNEWPPAINLAICPALLVAQLKPVDKRTAIMKGIESIMETGINPIDGLPLTNGVTAIMIKYLIAKHDKKEFVREKRFMLDHETVNILKWVKAMCKMNPKAEKFVGSLMVPR